MGLLTDADYTEMISDMVSIRGDNEIYISIRRGDDELPLQPVRIARQGTSSATTRNSPGAQEGREKIIVMGGIDFDVEPSDRFNDDNGILHEVVFVRPNRRIMVVAEAELIE